jgi:rare lipoprotein A
MRAVLALALPLLLSAHPGFAAPRERAVGSIIEIAPSSRPAPKSSVDHSGKARRLEAAVLNADPSGAPATAVSTVFPPGTTAKVQNVQNGRATLVQIRGASAGEDTRPLAITPSVARALGVSGNHAQILVMPLAVPQPDGTIRLGEGTGLAGRTAAPALSDRPQD